MKIGAKDASKESALREEQTVRATSYVELVNATKMPSVTELFVETGVNIPSTQLFRALCDDLSRNRTLRSLSLFYIRLEGTAAQHLFSALSSHPALETLRICFADLTDASTPAACEVLEGVGTLTSLDLGDNSLTDSSASCLSTALQRGRSTLISLWLNGNPITDRGVQSLIDALPFCRIRALRLHGCPGEKLAQKPEVQAILKENNRGRAPPPAPPAPPIDYRTLPLPSTTSGSKKSGSKRGSFFGKKKEKDKDKDSKSFSVNSTTASALFAEKDTDTYDLSLALGTAASTSASSSSSPASPVVGRRSMSVSATSSSGG